MDDVECADDGAAAGRDLGLACADMSVAHRQLFRVSKPVLFVMISARIVGKVRSDSVRKRSGAKPEGKSCGQSSRVCRQGRRKVI